MRVSTKADQGFLSLDASAEIAEFRLISECAPSAQVKKVNLPDGTRLWVTLDFKPVGTITLSQGSGSMAPYNMGRFGVSRDQVRVYNSLPDVSAFQQILIGRSFT
jgi:hypothetical protein